MMRIKSKQVDKITNFWSTHGFLITLSRVSNRFQWLLKGQRLARAEPNSGPIKSESLSVWSKHQFFFFFFPVSPQGVPGCKPWLRTQGLRVSHPHSTQHPEGLQLVEAAFANSGSPGHQGHTSKWCKIELDIHGFFELTGREGSMRNICHELLSLWVKVRSSGCEFSSC